MKPSRIGLPDDFLTLPLNRELRIACRTERERQTVDDLLGMRSARRDNSGDISLSGLVASPGASNRTKRKVKN